jgi:DivIVA domain-containing protein
VAKDDAGQRHQDEEGRAASRVVPPEIRNVFFHAAVRGYDRDEVDAYVKHVNRVVAELEVSSSPRAAVRHALDRVGDQVHGILQRARETADEVTSGALHEAEEITSRAKAEAAEIVVNASTEADAAQAGAAAFASQARSEAERILAQARSEAEQIVASAQTEASEHLNRTEDEAETVRRQAARDLRGIEEEVDSIAGKRDDLLDDVRRMAQQLQDLAGAKASEELTVVDEAAVASAPAVALDER